MTQTTDTYLDNLPDDQRIALQRLRESILTIIPEATETISTNVPAFRYKGKYLVSFSATKNHLALLIMQGNALKVFSSELKQFDTGRRIIRFTPNNPLPTSLVKKILLFRQAEING